ncbi:MAG: hypothetical protein WC438_04850 [Candidatus Pacearchaeota archaeon]
MVNENLKQKRKDITTLARDEILKENEGLMKVRLKKILEETTICESAGWHRIEYVIGENELNPSNQYSKEQMVTHFARGLCRRLRDSGLHARCEPRTYSKDTSYPNSYSDAVISIRL